MFHHSKFNRNLSDWPIHNILKVTNMTWMFFDCPAPNPWWYIEDTTLRNDAIKLYIGKRDLMHKLNEELIPSKLIKHNKI